LGALRFRVHRAHAAVLVEAITRLELRRARDKLLQERVVGALLDVKPLRGKTLLAAVEEAADRDRAGGTFEVGIVEHDAWIAAAELERDLLQGLGRFRHHALARRRGAGERDLADQRMLDDRLTCRLADDDVDHSLRQGVFPCSLVRTVAISSTFDSMCWAALCKISRRWLDGSLDHVPNAFAAA